MSVSAHIRVIAEGECRSSGRTAREVPPHRRTPNETGKPSVALRIAVNEHIAAQTFSSVGHVTLITVPTEDASRLIASLDSRQIHGGLHVTC